MAEENNKNPFANLDEDTQNKIQELQMLEHHLQQFMMQKNAFSMEDNETELIIKELEKTNEEVFRIIGNQVAIKSSKEKVLEEMKNKKKLIETRLNSMKKQEEEISEKIESLREDIMKKIQG